MIDEPRDSNQCKLHPAKIGGHYFGEGGNKGFFAYHMTT